jgi:aldehyde:ferredoxin oxidoreductase
MGQLYGGRILRVNLTEGTATTEPVASYADRFIGGKGINAKILFDEVSPDIRPFDAENCLLFGVGPLVSTTFPGACRIDVMAKSPVTGALGDSGMGGYLGSELKFAGYDNLVITGKAEKPVYLAIKDDEVEIRDAAAIWGHDTYETPQMIRQELNSPEAAVVSIGPAGENLVVYASIQSPSGNAAARTGLGAVMGSKMLKAIAVRGTRGIGIAQPREFLAACQKLRYDITQNHFYPDVHAWGLTKIHDKEMRFSYNIIGETFEGEEWEKVSEVDFAVKYLYNRVGCFACPVACFDSYDLPEAGGAGCMKCSPPGDLTWDVRNPDLMVFWKAFVLCQRYGLDARSLSNLLNWLMELYEHDIITAADTDGIAMRWGSPEAILSMARKLSYREGIGGLLADGISAAAKRFGSASEEYLLMSKGSLSDVHSIPIKSRALGFSVSPIGADAQTQPVLDTATTRKYLVARDEEEFQLLAKRYLDRAEQEVGIREAPDPRTTSGKAALVRQNEARTAMSDVSGVCTWMTSFIGLPVDINTIANVLTLGLGKTVTTDDVAQAGLRMQYLERAFEARLGMTRDDDKVSKGYYSRPKPTVKDHKKLGVNEAELENMKDDYYQMMGLDVKTGMPTREGLERLSMADVADRLGL